ncbi:MAG TPA: efflux RND transporter permease subunit [Steroidobacteraceae bacterium]|jgi:CzcA family heavy metal efflux pump|nr:efflux RND transporter permease subunit [Steroidobacteraceae bacterium]
MRRLIALAINHRGILAALAVVMLMYGAWLTAHGRYDVLPEFVPPTVFVQTEAPGLAPEQIETLVTRPLEGALSGIAQVERINSESIPGLSVITVVFEDSADIFMARQGVAERLAEMSGRLPPGVDSPRMSPLTSATMDLLKVGLVSDRVSARELRELADWELRPRLLAVPGVARITVYGGEQRQYQLQIDPARLAAHDLAWSDVVSAAQGALGVRGTGQVDLETQRIPITTAVTASALSALERTVVATRGDSAVLMRDVADVREGAAIPFGDAVIQGRRGVLLSLSSQYGANTLEVTRALEAVVQQVIPRLQARGITVYPALHRPATFIETAFGNLRNALALGGLLIVIVLFAFLRDVRSALISFLAIPLSLFAAVAVFEHFGMALNTLTLGGFAVALGVLVDDAVIYLENILRRLRENAELSQPRGRLEVIRDASVEISGSVVFATGVILLVFMPVFLLSGVQGRFMTPLALAFSLSVLASLLVALTVTPALAALLLRVEEKRPESAWLSRLRGAHQRALGACTARPRLTAILLGAALLLAAAVIPLLSGEFMPTFKEGHFVAQVASRVPGTSLAEMTRIGSLISAQLLKLPFIATVEQQVGRAEQGEDTWGPERCEFHIELKRDSGIDQEAAQQQIRAVMEKYPALQSDVLTFLGDRISESLSGETAQGVVQVFGPDLDVIERAAAEIEQRIAHVPGIVDVQRSHTGTGANLSVNLLPQRLAQYGLRAGEVLDAIQTAFAGTVVNQVYEKDHPVDVVALLPPSARASPEALRSLPLRSAAGPYVTLGDVAQIYLATGRSAIRHQAGQRFASVTFNAGARGIDGVAADVQRVATQVKLPAGAWMEFGGEAAAQQAARRDLILYSLVALSLIVMLLAAAFERRRLAGFVLLNLPFSLIGGVLALAITRQSLSLGALVGLVTVFGISSRNAILLLTHLEHLLDREGGAFDPALITRAAAERLLPVLMTALVTALGLIPLALGVGRAGNEIEAPLAIVVLGGLATSTVLCLIVLPAALTWSSARLARWFAPADRVTS